MLEALREDGGFRLVLPATPRGYGDAQVDDYRGLARSSFPWRAPVHFELEARCSHPQPLGTLGFGFWNDPFSAATGLGGAARRLPAAPQAVWFFYGSPPNELSISPDAPGHGWKAMSLAARSIPAPLLAPAAAGALALSFVPCLRKGIIGAIRRTISGGERALGVQLTDWHHYGIEWLEGSATFAVDGEVVLRAAVSPAGPLGFVAWIDNQYAVLSDERGIRFGVIPTDEEQWLEIRSMRLESVRSV